MLRFEELSAGYGAVQVLKGLSLTLPKGQITCLMGRNGAGKSTLLRSVMGQTTCLGGRILLEDRPIEGLPAHEIPRLGIGYVPQGRRLFGPLSVAENLQIGLMTRPGRADRLERVLELFPRLRERLNQRSSTLSGGEQQMLAIGRALCLEPSVLMLDEPTEGLQPSMIALIREVMLRLRDEGVTLLLVEHRVEAVLALADHVAFVANGRVPETCAVADLTPTSPQFTRYLGVS